MTDLPDKANASTDSSLEDEEKEVSTTRVTNLNLKVERFQEIEKSMQTRLTICYS